MHLSTGSYSGSHTPSPAPPPLLGSRQPTRHCRRLRRRIMLVRGPAEATGAARMPAPERLPRLKRAPLKHVTLTRAQRTHQTVTLTARHVPSSDGPHPARPDIASNPVSVHTAADVGIPTLPTPSRAPRILLAR